MSGIKRDRHQTLLVDISFGTALPLVDFILFLWIFDFFSCSSQLVFRYCIDACCTVTNLFD